mgnify:CR=1 FL=1
MERREESTPPSRIFMKSAIFALLISGIYFTFKSILRPSVTGAAVGGGSSGSSIVLGIILFLVALALAHHYDK